MSLLIADSPLEGSVEGCLHQLVNTARRCWCSHQRPRLPQPPNPFLTTSFLICFLPRFVTFLLDEKSNQKNQEEKTLAAAQTAFLHLVHRETLSVSSWTYAMPIERLLLSPS
jgi:hypothetical protein